MLANDDNTITSCQHTIACGPPLSGYEKQSLYTTADSSPLATQNTCFSCFWGLSHVVSAHVTTATGMVLTFCT